ncbi:hypothetical protein D9758_007710 [Tetrapyrgos nigripes]|uniref:V-type proton ATPase proteolipid subunit n=1 Tax=Tetrapyrgos nigripes TaxID=182062 RepID=A0A8H5G5A4_9AGAR|nr:hypothetical protein D9758_007710 [Tetrapyrgos nigripes]
MVGVGAGYGIAKSGVGISAISVLKPELMMRCTIPAVMAGIIGIYGLVVGVLISQNPHSFLLLGAGLSVGLAGIPAGFAIGIVGDAGVRGTAQQPRLYVGMILIVIFGEVLALYGLIIALMLNNNSRNWSDVGRLSFVYNVSISATTKHCNLDGTKTTSTDNNSFGLCTTSWLGLQHFNMQTTFFPGAHDFSFDRSTINNIQGDQHQTINNDNRNVSGSYNTTNTTNNNSQNTQWSNSDARRDNRRAHVYNHTQNANLESEYYSQSQPNSSRPQPHPQQRYPRQDVPYVPGAWNDPYNRSYPTVTHYDNVGLQSVGGQQRDFRAESFSPGPEYGYPSPWSHYSSPTSPAFHPPQPPASAPPALSTDSQEQYRQAHLNPFPQSRSQPYTPQSQYAEYVPRPLSANRASESTSSGYNSTSRNPFHRLMANSQRNPAGYNSANEDENEGADMDVDNGGTHRQSS